MITAVILGAWVTAQAAAPAPAPTSTPSNDELNALLRQLDEQAAATPPATAAGAPPVARPSLPAWMDMVQPVVAGRLRPFVMLGHPTSQQQPLLRLEARGWLGAELSPTTGVKARLVLAAVPSWPDVRAPGPETLLDAWVSWSYAALGGEVMLRGGRQELALTEMLLARNDWVQAPPRFDGVRAHAAWRHVFADAFAAVVAPAAVPTPSAPLELSGLAGGLLGVQDGDGRVVETHVLVLGTRMPVQGDAVPRTEASTTVDVGANAQWHAWGLSGRAALDVQQQRFEPPSIYAPAVAAHLSAGYAPHFAWAMGLYAEGGVRGAVGQPMTWLPGPAGAWNGWYGVRPLAFSPMYGSQHGAMGQMDLLGLRNAWACWGRVGISRDRLKDLSITVWELGLFDRRAAWYPAAGDVPLRRAGEGLGTGPLGTEIDVSATAELTRHITLSGAVGLFRAELPAASAFFSPFAETAYVSVDFHL